MYFVGAQDEARRRALMIKTRHDVLDAGYRDVEMVDDYYLNLKARLWLLVSRGVLCLFLQLHVSGAT